MKSESARAHILSYYIIQQRERGRGNTEHTAHTAAQRAEQSTAHSSSSEVNHTRSPYQKSKVVLSDLSSEQ